MPKTSKGGDAKQTELPSTLRRSPAKAQRMSKSDLVDAIKKVNRRRSAESR